MKAKKKKKQVTTKMKIAIKTDTRGNIEQAKKMPSTKAALSRAKPQPVADKKTLTGKMQKFILDQLTKKKRATAADMMEDFVKSYANHLQYQAYTLYQAGLLTRTKFEGRWEYSIK